MFITRHPIQREAGCRARGRPPASVPVRRHFPLTFVVAEHDGQEQLVEGSSLPLLMYQVLGGPMSRIDNSTITKMEIALEKACRVFPNGGDHESRKYVVEQLRLSARKGNTTLDGLCALADRLVERLPTRQSA